MTEFMEDGHVLVMGVYKGVLRPKVLCALPAGKCQHPDVGCVVQYTVWHEGDSDLFEELLTDTNITSFPVHVAWKEENGGIKLRILGPASVQIPGDTKCFRKHFPMITPEYDKVRQFLAFFGSMKDQVDPDITATLLGYELPLYMVEDGDRWAARARGDSK